MIDIREINIKDWGSTISIETNCRGLERFKVELDIQDNAELRELVDQLKSLINTEINSRTIQE